MIEIKGHRISLRFFRYPRKIKKERSAMKRLKLLLKHLLEIWTATSLGNNKKNMPRNFIA